MAMKKTCFFFFPLQSCPEKISWQPFWNIYFSLESLGVHSEFSHQNAFVEKSWPDLITWHIETEICRLFFCISITRSELQRILHTKLRNEVQISWEQKCSLLQVHLMKASFSFVSLPPFYALFCRWFVYGTLQLPYPVYWGISQPVL